MVGEAGHVLGSKSVLAEEGKVVEVITNLCEDFTITEKV